MGDFSETRGCLSILISLIGIFVLGAINGLLISLVFPGSSSVFVKVVAIIASILEIAVVWIIAKRMPRGK